MRKRILVNCISLFQGGPKSVGFGLIEGITLDKSNRYEWILILPSNVGYEYLEYPINNINKIFVNYPTKKFRFLIKMYYDHIYTSFLNYRMGVDKIFMTANFTSFLSKGSKQIVLQHNIHYLLEENPYCNLGIKKIIIYKLQKFLFKLTTLYNPHFVVQLNYMKDLLIKYSKKSSDRITVVNMIPAKNFFLNHTNYSSQFLLQKELFYKNKRQFNYFFPANYYPNKNHSILIPLAEFIQKENLPISIFITIDELDYIKLMLSNNKLKKIIINLGNVEYKYIRFFFHQMNYLFFPTSSESYGLPYVESIMSSLPIITTDYPFSREICRDCAYYFNEYDFNSLYKVVICSVNSKKYSQLCNLVKDRKKDYNHNWCDIINKIISCSH